MLGAWGLGWEVWLDGMEVTQFTYFQQVRADVLIAPRQQLFQQGELLNRYASHMCCAYGTSSSAK